MLAYKPQLKPLARRLRVLRFTDREVLQQLDAVVDAVFAAVSAASKSP